MRKLAFTLVPLLFVACGREPSAPTLPQISADRRMDAELIGPFDVVGEYFTSCGDFDILFDYSLQLRHNIYYDKNGDVAREQWLAHYLGQGRLYNSSYPNMFVLTGPGETQNSHWDRVNGWVVSAGDILKVVVPGIGPILMETGAWKVDIATWTWYHDSGHNDLGATVGWQGNVTALCELLTP